MSFCLFSHTCVLFFATARHVTWSDPEVPADGVPKRMRIWSKHSRPLTPAVLSEQPEKRAKIPKPASVNPETFAMMLESDDNLETYTELNAGALDLHEPHPETMWSSDSARGP